MPSKVILEQKQKAVAELAEQIKNIFLLCQGLREPLLRIKF